MRLLFALLAMVALDVSAQQELPPVPESERGYGELAPGSLLLESARQRNTGLLVMLGSAGLAYAVSRSNFEDPESTAWGILGCGMALGIAYEFSANRSQAQAAKLMQKRGY